MDMDKVLRRPELLVLIGVSSATQWRMEKAGQFPARFRLGKGLVGWHLTEVEEWLKNRERVLRQTLERKTVRRAVGRVVICGSQSVTPVGDPVALDHVKDRRSLVNRQAEEG
jgi:prophage regulatory protein